MSPLCGLFFIMPSEIPAVGTKQERKTFNDVIRHYDMARADLDRRRTEFNKVDELFRSHIDESSWPYQSLIFDPRTFTSIFEKTSRLFAKKPKGRLVPREGGDAIGAAINNQLLDFQWDDNERVDGMPMLAKWALMDQNARKYGASFALVKYRHERQVKIDRKKDEKKPGGKSEIFFDGPDFQVLTNRDVLLNPAYSTIKNWFQYREYVTLDELKNVNDVARGKPIYKNLDLLMQRLQLENSSSGGDTRSSNYTSRNKSIVGLPDRLGEDLTEQFKIIEVTTEYRRDRWVTFSSKHGVILRDIPNPYDHGQIPVVMLKYYPIDDDIYGLSEIEPVMKLQKATNALWSQYVDQINMSLYSPLKIRSEAVQMHTLEFGPGKKWLMNDPSSDVIAHDQPATGVQEFATTYRLLINAIQEGLGETSAGVSAAIPGVTSRTATEIQSADLQRRARDNYNQIFLGQAIKTQMMFWQRLNTQFFFQEPSARVKVIRIVGKDAIRYFEQVGLDGKTLSDEAIELLTSPEVADMDLDPLDFVTDAFPVKTKDDQLPKFIVEDTGEVGHLILEPDDLSGTYDYIPDIESMVIPDKAQTVALKRQLFELSQNPVVQQSLVLDGFRVKTKELLEDLMEEAGVKDADKYFEKTGGPNGETNLGGGEVPGAGQSSSGTLQPQGVAGSNQASLGTQGPPQLG